MPGSVITQAGNYSLLIDTGYDVGSFTLDSATKGLLDGVYPLGPTTDFADVTDSTTQISIRRGRRDIGDQFAAGTMTFTINDVDGIFNPFDENGPYYNTPEARYNSVETVFGALTNAQRDNVAIIDIADTISIQRTFVTGSTTTTLAQELSVEGVEHVITLDGHRVALFTSPTTIVFELILDNLTYGTLSTTNVLG